MVFGLVCRAWAIEPRPALSAYAWQSLRQQLVAAQRLGRIGQSELQARLHALKPDIEAAVERSLKTPIEDAGAFGPWLDLAGIGHQRQFARLFLS